MSRKIFTKTNRDELSASAAELFARIANNSLKRSGHFSLALAGGSTPRSLYSLLASKYTASIDWSRVTFFFTDERNVPHDSPGSNYRMAAEVLLEPLKIDPRSIHRWRTELPDVKETAAEYASNLEKHFHFSKPRFDIVLLGLGPDAHTASLFPHTAALHETEKLAVANWVEKLDDYRFTMTFPVINNAANVIFLVSGEEKAEALASVLEAEFRSDEFPGQLVRPENGALYWLLDEAAAKLLDRR